MSTKRRNRKTVYVVSGTALDQETIIRQRPMIEDYVRNDMRRNFRKTNVSWSMNKNGTFDFNIEFYD